jgi:hypothetical protein
MRQVGPYHPEFYKRAMEIEDKIFLVEGRLTIEHELGYVP